MPFRQRPLLAWAGVGVLVACAIGLLLVGYLGWAVAVGIVVVLAVRAPRVLVILLPPTIAFGSLFPLGIGSLSAGPTDLLVAGLLLGIGWMLRQRAMPHWPFGDGAHLLGRAREAFARGVARWPVLASLLGALACYLVVILLSGLVAINRADVVKEALKWAEVLIVLVATWLLVRRSPRTLALTLWCAVATGLAEALLGYAQWVLGAGDLGPGGDSIRVFGTFGQPNPYAADLNLALLPALAAVLFGADARARWVLGAAAVLIFGAQVLADSRGALLALAAAVVVLVVLGWRREREAALAILVGVPLLAVAWLTNIIPAHLRERLLAQVRLSDIALGGQVNDANYSTIERLAHWVAGVRMFAAHPLLGVGAGNYNAAYARYALPGWPEPLGHAHNYFINAAAETGILGLLAFLAVVVAALYSVWRGTRVATDAAPVHANASPDDGVRSARPLAGRGVRLPRLVIGPRAWALGCAAVVVAILVHSLVDDLFVHAMELQFALMLGILAVRASSFAASAQRASRPARMTSAEADRG